MMGWYGQRLLMGGGSGFFEIIFLVFLVFCLVDVILLASLAWKQLIKK